MKNYPHGLTLNAVCDAIDAYREQEDDVPEAGMIAAFEILLAAMDKPETALTAQPVKLAKNLKLSDKAHQSHIDYAEGYNDRAEMDRAAIRAAGYEVAD